MCERKIVWKNKWNCVFNYTWRLSDFSTLQHHSVRRCEGCGEELGSGDVAVRAERAGANKVWHPQCFKCFKCKVSNSGTRILRHYAYFIHLNRQSYLKRTVSQRFWVKSSKAVSVEKILNFWDPNYSLMTFDGRILFCVSGAVGWPSLLPQVWPRVLRSWLRQSDQYPEVRRLRRVDLCLWVHGCWEPGVALETLLLLRVRQTSSWSQVHSRGQRASPLPHVLPGQTRKGRKLTKTLKKSTASVKSTGESKVQTALNYYKIKSVS